MKQTIRPDDETILKALEAVLSSALFARSERLRAFLKYVVEKEMEGTGHQLKGYTIGIDVFDRPQAFNADSDPLVRVHAGKLRKLLTAYYAGEGAADPWRIDIPKGTYVPEYRCQQISATPSAASPAAAHSARKPAGRRLSWLPAPLSSPLSVLSALPLLVFLPLSSPALSINIPAQSRLHDIVLERKFGGDLPRITVRAGWPRTGTAGRFADALRNAASHYRTVATVPATVLSQKPSVKSADPLAFTIEVSRKKSPQGLRVLVTNDASSDVVHETFIDDGVLTDEADILYESLAIASQTLSSQGHIFTYASAAAIDSPLMQCMVLTDSYRHLQTRESFQEAKDCQEKLSGDHRQKLKFVISAGALPLTLIR
ncbi:MULTISPECIES: hypothetical protein [unclassified Rhizobium]|uniref:hypothetical protein n=1 Tax=unclassified Rhizobium TaxID=2613769 RepID=UPI000713CFEA|nr:MULTISPECIES: hypothetical protein [unclassified Rhizobium]KQS97952.1 hypothetical protein ASG50_22420 [Rhizobium sp. Leaf386]KQT00209.1 hypothetical protein ASG42_05010 [Rhizobium sp. Leaf391]KQT97215.1 hypothetical protein ASG68_09740 [Rhizobium sp. Leaf453]